MESASSLSCMEVLNLYQNHILVLHILARNSSIDLVYGRLLLLDLFFFIVAYFIKITKENKK